MKKSYAKVIGSETNKVRKHMEESSNDMKWQVVSPIKRGVNGKKASYYTIFINGIPSEFLTKDVWNLFKDCEKVFDIIL